MYRSARKAAALAAAVFTLALLVAAPTAGVAKPASGSYKGKLVNVPSGSDNGGTLSFKVRGGRVTGLKAKFWYLCAFGLAGTTLNYYTFPSVSKRAIRVKRGGKFSVRETVDREAGFTVTFAGRLRGSKAKGTITLKTTTRGAACSANIAWTAGR